MLIVEAQSESSSHEHSNPLNVEEKVEEEEGEEVLLDHYLVMGTRLNIVCMLLVYHCQKTHLHQHEQKRPRPKPT
jgi:hypothetical protein